VVVVVGYGAVARASDRGETTGRAAGCPAFVQTEPAREAAGLPARLGWTRDAPYRRDLRSDRRWTAPKLGLGALDRRMLLRGFSAAQALRHVEGWSFGHNRLPHRCSEAFAKATGRAGEVEVRLYRVGGLPEARRLVFFRPRDGSLRLLAFDIARPGSGTPALARAIRALVEATWPRDPTRTSAVTSDRAAQPRRP